MASKAAQVQVDRVTPTDQAGSGKALRRGRRADPVPWGSGRLTLTSLHLTFVPASGSSGVPALTLVLADILAIEITGRGHRTVAFRTDQLVLRARLPGAAAFARQVATSVESNRKRSAAYPSHPEPDESPLSSG